MARPLSTSAFHPFFAAMSSIEAKYPNVDRLQPLFDRFAALEKTIPDFKGKAIKSTSGKDDLCLDYSKRDAEFNQCSKK